MEPVQGRGRGWMRAGSVGGVSLGAASPGWAQPHTCPHGRPPSTQVKFGSREWVLGRVEYDTRASDLPLSLILPLVIVPMVAVIAVSVYCYW